MVLAQRIGNPPRHFARQMHCKALITNRPADQFRTIRQVDPERTFNAQACATIGHECSRRTIAELKHCEQRLNLDIILQMERRNLNRDHQNARGRIRTHDMARAAQRCDRGITAHESDEQPLNPIR